MNNSLPLQYVLVIALSRNTLTALLESCDLRQPVTESVGLSTFTICPKVLAISGTFVKVNPYKF